MFIVPNSDESEGEDEGETVRRLVHSVHEKGFQVIDTTVKNSNAISAVDLLDCQIKSSLHYCPYLSDLSLLIILELDTGIGASVESCSATAAVYGHTRTES